jgi:HEAT repeat protein
MRKLLLGILGVVVCLTPAWGADVSALIAKLKDPDSDLRREAAQELAKLGKEAKAAVPALIGRLNDKDVYVRRYSAQALGAIGPDAKSAVPALRKLLNDDRKPVRDAAVTALGKVGEDGVGALIGIIKDTNLEVTARKQAIEVLGSLGAQGKPAIAALTEVLARPARKGKKPTPDDLRIEAASALGNLASPTDKEAVEALRTIATAKKGNRLLRKAAQGALRKIKEKQS